VYDGCYLREKDVLKRRRVTGVVGGCGVPSKDKRPCKARVRRRYLYTRLQ
jgi:hypothetical protein